MVEQTKDKTETAKDQQPPPAAPTDQAQTQASTPLQIHWDDTNMTTAYSNVVNASSTREEVTLFFGTNQTWNVAGSGEVKIQLTNRIVVNPFAAKRLWTLLGNVLGEYESRFGKLDVQTGNGAGGAGN